MYFIINTLSAKCNDTYIINFISYEILTLFGFSSKDSGGFQMVSLIKLSEITEVRKEIKGVQCKDIMINYH